MCFKIKSFYPKLIAKRDIVCYKVISKNNRSYFMSFSYTPNKRYEIDYFLWDMNIHRWVGNYIKHGYHSYVSCDNAVLSYEYKRNYTKIVRMTIPAGAEYYYNPDDGEYVSNKIVTGDLKPVDPEMEAKHRSPSGFINWFKMYILRR